MVRKFGNRVVGCANPRCVAARLQQPVSGGRRFGIYFHLHLCVAEHDGLEHINLSPVPVWPNRPHNHRQQPFRSALTSQTGRGTSTPRRKDNLFMSAPTQPGSSTTSPTVAEINNSVASELSTADSRHPSRSVISNIYHARLAQRTRAAASITARFGASSPQAVAAEAKVTASKATSRGWRSSTSRSAWQRRRSRRRMGALRPRLQRPTAAGLRLHRLPGRRQKSLPKRLWL